MKYNKINMDKILQEYEIYEDGRIYDKIREVFCKEHNDAKGYKTVTIRGCGSLHVHRLVLFRYNPIDNEEDMQVNHINCNKADNRLENLEWTTQSENQKHAFRNGLLSRKGSKNSQSKLTEEDVLVIIDRLLSGETDEQIAQDYPVTSAAIGRIRNHHNWVGLTGNITFPNEKVVADPPFADELLKDLQDDIDIDILSEKYNMSNRLIRDFKYRHLRRY